MLRAIVDRARQGDEEAFGALVREVGDRCIFIAHRILRDANLAEDAVQMALVQVWRELPEAVRGHQACERRDPRRLQREAPGVDGS
jgi:DNA-directed RNA polymerase specialized sigma24 family protein